MLMAQLSIYTFVEVEKDDETKQTALQPQNFVDFILISVTFKAYSLLIFRLKTDILSMRLT